MSYLLDTHLLIWATFATDRLPAAARRIIEDHSVALAFSVLSIWETAIKSGRGRTSFSYDAAAMRAALVDVGYREIPILSQHALAVLTLPPVHADPFDRLLLAQARAEGMLLLTADRALGRYGGGVEVV